MTRKPRRLTFPMTYLEPVRSGSKACTIRFSRTAAVIQRNDHLLLCFGRYDAPVILEAACTKVAHLDLTGPLKMNLADAIRDTAGSFRDIQLEAKERGSTTIHCIWFALEHTR